MKKLMYASLVAVIFTFVLVSCRKSGTSSPSPPANAAPAIYNPFNTFSYFVTAQVTTAENYNYYSGGAPCLGRAATLFSIANTKGQGQQFSLGYATAAIAPAMSYNPASAMGVSVGAYHLSFDPMGCVGDPEIPLSIGYSDTIVFGAVNTWSFYAGASGDSVIWYYPDAGPVPSVSDISSGSSVSTENSYTLTAPGAVSGDSVIFSITGPDAKISQVLGPNAAACTFSAAQMATLGTTGSYATGLLQIAPYNFHMQLINGDTCYFAKEACVSRYVVLQ